MKHKSFEPPLVVRYKSHYSQALWQSIMPALSMKTKKELTESKVRRIISNAAYHRLCHISHLLREGAIDGAKFHAIRRCPPTSCYIPDKAFSCGHPLICPFCWQRFVVRPCARAFLGLTKQKMFKYRLNDQFDRCDIGLRLVGDARIYRPKNVPEAIAAFEDQSSFLSSTRRRKAYLGAHKLVTLIPYKRTWIAKRTTLAIVAKGYFTDCAERDRRQTTVMYDQTFEGILDQPEKIAELVAKACTYPIEYLSAEPYNSLSRLLTKAKTPADSQPKTRAFSGVLHGRTLLGAEVDFEKIHNYQEDPLYV